LKSLAKASQPSRKASNGIDPFAGGPLTLPDDVLRFARGLRQTQTDAETRLWSLLRDRRLGGRKFRRQHPIPPYVVDFYCDEARLVLELDGGQHAEMTERDERRTAFLKERGLRVWRYWYNAVLDGDRSGPGRHLECVARTLTRRCAPPSPNGKRVLSPLPIGRGVGGEGISAPCLAFEIFTPSSESEVPRGTVTRARATCPCCDTTLAPDRVRAQLSAQRGGADVKFDDAGGRSGGATMLAVVTMRPGIQGRLYRLPTDRDYAAVRHAAAALKKIVEAGRN
jgi:very-short-patch-repair endonuclease